MLKNVDSAGDLTLPARAFFWVVAMRAALWLVPFRRLCPAVRTDAHAGPEDALTGARVGEAIRRAARYVPRATCLTQALAACRMLTALGCASRLEIGVAQGTSGNLEAHAWVECGGEVIVGGETSGRFRPLRRPSELPS